MSRTQADGLLLLDKPAGWSSTQALARAKRWLAATKAGHTGTLDPFATGLLPIVFGEATKFSRFAIDATKRYLATLRLGQRSSTGDPEGELSAPAEVAVDDAAIDAVLRSLLGPQEQLPPMHSAVRIQGRRLYEMARAGQEVERAPRRIDILALQRHGREGTDLSIDVTCSKGTYIRTLAQDVGDRLGCGAYLVALRRTAVGPFRLEEAVELATLEQEGPEAARRRLQPLERLVEGLPRCDAGEVEGRRFGQGQEIAFPGAVAGAEYAVHGAGGAFLGVGRSPAAGRLAPLRLLGSAAVPKLPDFA